MRFGTYHVAVIHAHEWARPNRIIEKNKFENLLKEKSKFIISFEEFKKWEPEILFWQKANERIYVFYERVIKQYLVKLYKIIVG